MDNWVENHQSAAHLRLASTFIEHLSWQDCIERYDRPHTLFYMDPPYWQTEGYGVPFGIEQYEEMANMLAKLKGKAIISPNDHPDVRRIFTDYHIETTGIRYAVGGGKGSDAKEVDLQLGCGCRTCWLILILCLEKNNV